jgi:hypothetical protein
VRTAASTPCVFGQVKASRDSGIFEVPSGGFYSWTTADMICFDTAVLAERQASVRLNADVTLETGAPGGGESDGALLSTGCWERGQ